MTIVSERVGHGCFSDCESNIQQWYSVHVCMHMFRMTGHGMGESEIEDGLYFTTKVQASRVDRVFAFGWCRTATYNPGVITP